MKKIKSFLSIKKISRELKRKGKKIVFTNGCFDILHYGHLKYLEKCKKLGDILVIGLNSDASVKKLKGRKRPINFQRQRAEILAALECVDYVVIFPSDTPLNLIKGIVPHVLAKGGDWSKNDIVGSAFILKSGGRVTSVKFIKGYSTSDLIKRLKNE